MTSIQELRLDALIRLQILCVALDSDLNPLEGYIALKASLDSIIGKIINARAINEQDIKDKAIIKEQARLYMEDLVYSYVQRAVVKAHDAADVDLEVKLTHPKTYLTAADSPTSKVRAEELKKIMNDNLSILTNIEPADITKMEAAIKAYDDLLYAPKNARDFRKVKGTDPIPGLLNEADVPKTHIGNLFHSYLPDQASLYEQAVKVGTPSGTRHKSIIITYIDAETGARLRSIRATLSFGIDIYSKLSTKKGTARFLSLPEGNYTLTSENKKYTTDQRKNIAITDKNCVNLEVILMKLSPTGTLQLYIFDANTQNPLPEVHTAIPQLSFNGLTNAEGKLLKKNIPPGTYHVLLSKEGYIKTDFTFTVIGSETHTLQFDMESSS